MRKFAYVRVVCDICNEYEQHVDLLDKRGVDNALLESFWKIENNQDVCPDCAEKKNDTLE